MPGKPKKKLKHGPLFWAVTTAGVIMTATALSLVDLKSLHAHAAKLNGPLLFGAMTALPIAGFPASIFYVVDGAHFGKVWGLTLAATAIALQLVCFWWIAHSWLKQPLDRLFMRLHYHKSQIPEGEYIPVCLLIWLMPGIPYAAKNYLVALSGAPFRYYFWTALPAHFLSASLGILFGDFIGTMTTARIIFLVCYALLLGGFSFYVVRRLKARQELSTTTLKD